MSQNGRRNEAIKCCQANYFRLMAQAGDVQHQPEDDHGDQRQHDVEKNSPPHGRLPILPIRQFRTIGHAHFFGVLQIQDKFVAVRVAFGRVAAPEPDR